MLVDTVTASDGLAAQRLAYIKRATYAYMIDIGVILQAWIWYRYTRKIFGLAEPSVSLICAPPSKV